MEQAIIFVVLILILYIIFKYTTCNKSHNDNNENFYQSDELDHLNHSIDYTNAYDNENNMVGMRNKIVDNYITVDEFNEMVDSIKVIIKLNIIKYARECDKLNGDSTTLINNKQFTIVCNNNPWEMEENIIIEIMKYIIAYCENNFKISINPYQIIHTCMRHLNLLEGLIYQLQNSQIYTIHGYQYFTESLLDDKINKNLHINDVLHTLLSKRGVIVILNNDMLVK
jgi:hypothetical protein